MAITIAQKPDGTSITFDRGKFQGTSAYVIRDDGGLRIDTSDIMGNSGVLAKLAPVDYYVGGSGALSDLGGYWSSRLRQVAFDLRQVDAGGYVWEATVSFDSNIGDATTPPVDQKNESQPGFIAIEYQVNGESVDVWRTKTTGGSWSYIPSNGNSPAQTDIGGVKVDANGEPVSAFVNVARVTVRNVVVGRPNPPLSYINKRNSASFSVGPYSFPAGTLLFTGCSISRVGVSTYEIVYSFAYDADFHLRQITKRIGSDTVTGASTDSCNTSDSTAVPANEVAKARCVYWAQPFPETTAFSGIGILT